MCSVLNRSVRYLCFFISFFPDKFRCFFLLISHDFWTLPKHLSNFLFLELFTVKQQKQWKIKKTPQKRSTRKSVQLHLFILFFSVLNVRAKKFSLTFRFRNAICVEFECAAICISCVFYFNGFCIIYSWFSSFFSTFRNATVYLFQIFMHERRNTEGKKMWHCRWDRKTSAHSVLW